MVTKYTKSGLPYKTPPYTEEEIDEFDQLMINVRSITVIHSAPTGNGYRRAPMPESKIDDDDLLE